MLYKKVLLILLVFATCRGMEKTQDSKTTTKITIITQDNESVDVPDSCMSLCKHFKDMLEDYLKPQKHEIRLRWIAQDVKAVFSLLEGKQSHSETQYQHSIQGYPLLDLARMVALVNFLDCPSIFADVLLVLSQKIDQIKHSAGSELWEQLEEILPRELQKMIQEIVLIKHNAIAPLIKVTHRIKELFISSLGFENSGNRRFLQWSPQGRFLAIAYGGGECEVIVYDLAGPSIKKCLQFRTNYFTFSSDERYLLYHWRILSNLVDLQTGQHQMFPTALLWPGYVPSFSSDSKSFTINNARYSVETTQQLENNDCPLFREDTDPIPLIRNQFPELRLDLGIAVELNFSLGDQFLAIKTRDNPSLLYLFDMGLPEAIKLCFSGQADRNMCRVFSRGNSVFLNMGFRNPFMGGRYDSIIHVDLNAQKYYEIPTVQQELIAFADDRILVLSEEKKMSMYFFMASISQWISIDLAQNFPPMQPTRYGENPKEALFFADFDKNYFAVREERSGQSFFEMHFVPRDLLLHHCTLKEMLMVINYAKDPLLQSDPHYKSIYDNLDAEVRKFLNMETIEEEPAIADRFLPTIGERFLSQEDADMKAIEEEVSPI